MTTTATTPDRWKSRKHGTRSGYVGGCRCEPCMEAQRAYAREHWRKYRSHFEGIPHVSASHARVHILMLRSKGMGKRSIAAASGVSLQTIDKISRGDYARGIRPLTAQRILAVRLSTYQTPATAAVRRVHALAVMGYTARQIADTTTVHHRHIAAIMAGEHERIRTTDHHKIRAGYDTLSMRPGPSALARRRALGKGWPPPLAWDDDTIDDPSAQPAGTYTPHTRGVDLDELDHLVQAGEHPDNIARRIDRPRDTIRQACTRAGRLDLANLFGRAA